MSMFNDSDDGCSIGQDLHKEESVGKITGYRRAEPSDLPRLERLMRPAIYQIFGKKRLKWLYEVACLSLVQHDEKQNVVSGVFLCNYPNIRAVPPYDWPFWLGTIYPKMQGITTRNTLFVHLLVWDECYATEFLRELLAAIFDSTIYCNFVILVVPPQVTPADIFDKEMVKVLAKDMQDTPKDNCVPIALQFLYVDQRYRLRPKLKIRRVVEEDNDDVVPIIEGESAYLKDLYGPYYISELIRNSDGTHQLIIGEDADGKAAGVVCLNSMLDVDLLNETFELTPYHGLRKACEDDESVDRITETTYELLHSLASEHVRNLSDTSRVCKTTATESKSTEINVKSGEASPTHEEAETTRMKLLFPTSEPSNLVCAIAYAPTYNSLAFLGNVTNIDNNILYAIGKVGLFQQNASLSCTKSNDLIQYFESKQLYNKHMDRIANSSIQSPNDPPISDLLLISDYFNAFQLNLQSSNSQPIFELFHEGSNLPSVDEVVNEITRSRLLHNVPHPKYHGEINAFSLEIFCVRGDMKPHWSHDFLECAFDCFPNRDYCVVLLPSFHPCKQFLQHFVRVPLRNDKDFSMLLYIIHRAIFSEEMECRRSQAQDRQDIEELLLTIPTKQQILADFNLTLNPLHVDTKCFIFKCKNTLIGFVILCAEKQVDFIRRYYHVEDHVSLQNIHQDEYGHLLHFVLMPIFCPYHRFFFREIARLSELTVFFYRIHYVDESILTRMHSLVSCLDDMIPVNPRKQARYTFPISLKDSDIKAKDKEDHDEDKFSLFIMSPRLATMSRTIIDIKIVVVGASDCGVAFAEYLSLRSPQNYMEFTNLTLISPHGLPYDSKQAEARLLPFRGKFCWQYRCSVAARTWINIIYGTVVAINRKEKYVTVLHKGNLVYDFLILTCGLQYQKPILREEKETQKGIIEENEIPWNCLTVNDDTEAFVCVKKIQCLTKDFKEQKEIIFYGRNIDCYCALNGLIDFGVKPEWITLIEPALKPHETHDDVFFRNSEVDEAMMNAISQIGVKILSEWNINDCSVARKDDGKLMIESIAIEQKGVVKNLTCDALFSFHEKTINLNTFLAFSRADLVYDGLLVIDPECRTNDQFIYAAGTVTKYSRRYYAEFYQHAYYNSVEIGERLAQILRKVIDAYRWDLKYPAPSRTDEKPYSIPILRAPVVIACTLPGGYYYLHVHKPGKKDLSETEISGENGEIFVTGSCTSEIGYFCIQLNAFDSVESVTCVSRKVFQVHDMIALYGKHDSMLNELKFRFKSSNIFDFYAYFREPWAAAIFYDKFECLRVENRATLLSRTNVDGVSLVDDCMRVLIKSNWKAISAQDRSHIASKYAGSVYHQELERSLIKFLNFSEDDLPMYCTLRKQRHMYMDIEDSLLFFQQ